MRDYKKEYKYQISRIKQAIKRMEAEGYIVLDNIIPNKPKRITEASIRKLKKITPQIIRNKSYRNINNKIIPPKSRSKYEKKQTKKAIQPKRQKTNLPKPKLSTISKRNNFYKSHKDKNKSERPLNNITDNILNNIYSQIEAFEIEIANYQDVPFFNLKMHDANTLKNILENAYRVKGQEALGDSTSNLDIIVNKGREIVSNNLQEYADVVNNIIESILYDSDDEQVNLNLETLYSLALGRELSPDEVYNLDAIQSVINIENYE